MEENRSRKNILPSIQLQKGKEYITKEVKIQNNFDSSVLRSVCVRLCDLDMPLPLDIVWSKNGTATKCKNNVSFKITKTTFVIASVLIVFFVCCLSPIGVSADSVDDENDDTMGLQDLGHERQRRAAITPLGKRLTTKLVAELGTRPRHLYSFGIGKRSISNSEMQEFLEEEAQKGAEHQTENNHVGVASNQHASDVLHSDDELEKRNPYSFGLGKRGGEPYSFGMGRKRDPYAFGLGKRDPYAFGLGKRNPYSFGLGKRDPYSFGLGKRDPYSFGLGKRVMDKKDPYSFGLGKRDPYSFGLGKRSVKRDPYSFGLGKRDPYAFGLGKRDPYSFGLGKRDPYGFGLGKRNPYSFGLGKRDPYSFGLGKRSGHIDEDEDPYAFGFGKRDPYSFGLGKRDPYSFGLGK